MAEPSIEVLLVGPRVSHLRAHFEQRGFRCDAFPEGGPAMSALEAKRRDIVLLEVNLGDQSAAEFVERARASEPDAVYLLLDDPSRAGQIVKAFQAGVMRYLSTPPDEARLFREVERLAIVSRALSGLLFEDKARELRLARDAEQRAQNEALEASMQSELVAQELAELKRELQELRARPTTEAVDALRAERDEAAEREASLRHRAEELAGELTTLEQRAGELEGARDELAASLAAARQEARAHEERVRDLEEALGDEQKRAARLASEGGAFSRRADELDAKRRALKERTVDLELQLDEAHTKVAFMEEQVQAAEARAAEAEARLKKDRLRLIEDKEHAAAGSHEAWQKMERMAGEVQAAKAARADAERRVAELERRLEATVGER